jgi:hypothetical protein
MALSQNWAKKVPDPSDFQWYIAYFTALRRFNHNEAGLLEDGTKFADFVDDA